MFAFHFLLTLGPVMCFIIGRRAYAQSSVGQYSKGGSTLSDDVAVM